MRKLLLAGLAVASLTSIAFAQVAFSEVENVPKTCVDADGVTRKLNDTTTVGTLEFRCVQTFGERLKPKGADWILVPVGRFISVFRF